MQLGNTGDRYGLVAMLFHWVVALAVFAMYGLGLYLDSLSYYDPNYRLVPHWHKSIGILLAVVLVARLIWRFLSMAPAPMGHHSAVERGLARWAHTLLYLLTMATIIVGYLISTADGRSVDVFSWFSVPALPLSIEKQEDIAGEFHFWLATALAALALLHGAAAMKHHIVDGDATLKRILPQFSKETKKGD